MHAVITQINKFNYNDVITLISAIMKDNGIPFKRASSEQFVSSHDDNIFVLEVNEVTMGMYAYSDNPNNYTLNFFALNPFIRKTRVGYKLYSDMADRLKGKPVIVPVYSENKNMLAVVEKRGVFLGRFMSSTDKTIDYYSINFGDKEWKK